MATKKQPEIKITKRMVKKAIAATHVLYELYYTKGKWKWRKRFKNGKIPNHQYNSKAAAIKGMRADHKATVESEFKYKEV